MKSYKKIIEEIGLVTDKGKPALSYTFLAKMLGMGQSALTDILNGATASPSEVKRGSYKEGGVKKMTPELREKLIAALTKTMLKIGQVISELERQKED